MATAFSLALRRAITRSLTANFKDSGKTLRCASVLPTSAANFQKRCISQKVLEEEEAKQITWMDWLWTNVFKFSSSEEQVITPEEIQQRDELLSRIQACYYKKPPEEPGIEYFVEAFKLLIKYDDWRGVEGLWRMAEHHQHEFDDDLLDKIEDYLLEARQRRWYE